MPKLCPTLPVASMVPLAPLVTEPKISPAPSIVLSTLVNPFCAFIWLCELRPEREMVPAPVRLTSLSKMRKLVPAVDARRPLIKITPVLLRVPEPISSSAPLRILTTPASAPS
jgi:hypothetical protein